MAYDGWHPTGRAVVESSNDGSALAMYRDYLVSSAETSQPRSVWSTVTRTRYGV